MTRPTTATVKRLFAVSGNLCAFPKCKNTLVDQPSGKVTGEICHINARSADGPRFEAEQTDEERHSYGNLLLLCPIHHKVIDDDPVAYTTERLRQMKSTHEDAQPNIGELNDVIANTLIANLRESSVRNGSIIISNNQMGGQIAHSITNNGPQPRRITKMAADQLVSTLKLLPAETVSIRCVLGDVESLDLATSIKTLLERSGWKVQTLQQCLFNEAVKGLYVQTPADTQGIIFLIRWMKTAGLAPNPCLVRELTIPEIVVGGNL